MSKYLPEDILIAMLFALPKPKLVSEQIKFTSGKSGFRKSIEPSEELLSTTKTSIARAFFAFSIEVKH
jgi:hypothetical protein